VALSDPLGIIASPLTIVTRNNTPDDAGAIIKLARANGAELIIVGLPYSMDGTLGSQAEKVKTFVAEIKSLTDIPIEYRDERLSTVLAKKLVQKARKTGRQTRYDAAAAALILQSFLDSSLPPREFQENESSESE
jgi:putative holliday junction resolvase